MHCVRKHLLRTAGSCEKIQIVDLGEGGAAARPRSTDRSILITGHKSTEPTGLAGPRGAPCRCNAMGQPAWLVGAVGRYRLWVGMSMGDTQLLLLPLFPRPLHRCWGLPPRSSPFLSLRYPLPPLYLGAAPSPPPAGCGFGTQPWKLALSSNVHWFDVDLAEVLEEKQALLVAAGAQLRPPPVRCDLASSGSQREHAGADADGDANGHGSRGGSSDGGIPLLVGRYSAVVADLLKGSFADTLEQQGWDPAAPTIWLACEHWAALPPARSSGPAVLAAGMLGPARLPTCLPRRISATCQRSCCRAAAAPPCCPPGQRLKQPVYPAHSQGPPGTISAPCFTPCSRATVLPGQPRRRPADEVGDGSLHSHTLRSLGRHHHERRQAAPYLRSDPRAAGVPRLGLQLAACRGLL